MTNAVKPTLSYRERSGEDIAQAYFWHSTDPEYRLFQSGQPWEPVTLEEFAVRVAAKKSQFRTILLNDPLTSEQTPVGYVALSHLSPTNPRPVQTFTISVFPPFQSKGIASVALKWLVDQCFEEWGVQILGCQFAAANQRAWKAYQRAGMTTPPTGVESPAFRGEESAYLELSKEDWLQMKK